MSRGYRSSEFWLSAITVIVSSLLATNVLPAESVEYKITAVVAAVLTTLGYTTSRSIIKKTDMEKPQEPNI